MCVCVCARARACVHVFVVRFYYYYFIFIYFYFYFLNNTLCKLFWYDYALHAYRISYLGQYVSCEHSGR